jgi:membrane protein implicated in regulation of membrane protease activity
VRYVLYQLPALLLVIAGAAALVRWFDVQPWIAVAVVLVWAIKDAVLYPLTWKAYDRDRRDDAHTMVGKCGTARERLDPDGYVVVDGELWRARLERACRPVQKGCPVIVKRIEGLTLVVEYQQNVPG